MSNSNTRLDLWKTSTGLFSLTPASIRFVVVTLAFCAGNLILPALAHYVPDGGRLLLPIEFFTLVAAWRYGLGAGLATALLSPLANHLVTGMPPTFLLPSLMFESVVLAVLASVVARKTPRLTLAALALVVVLTQLLGFGADLFLAPPMAVSGLLLGIPGMVLQIVGGWLALKALSKQEHV